MDDVQKRFLLFIRLASFLGVWPTQTYRERILRYFVLGFTLLSVLALQLCQVFAMGFNLRSFIFIFQLIIPDVCFVAQYATIAMHFTNVEKTVNIIKRDWQQVKNDDELKIMQKHVYQSTIFTIVCGSLFFLFICLMILPPILHRILSPNGEISNSDRFPIFSCIDCLLDPKTFYYPVLICEVVLFSTTMLTALACYSLYFWNVQHICAHLSIIKIKLHRPFINNDYDVESMDLSHWMVDIIQHFAQVTESVKLTNKVGEKNRLLQIALAFVLVVIDFLYLWQIPILLAQKDGKHDVFMFVVFITSNLLPIYVSCYIGQRLIDYSEEVYQEACLVPIHEISLKTQKLLLMALIMNAKPFKITIGKVFVSSHQFFSDMLRASLSFAMMLHSTQNL